MVSVLVSFAGPFGTYASMRAPVRLVYWGLLLGGAVPVASLCRRAVRPWLIGAGRWTGGVIVSAIFATLYAPFVYGITLWLEVRGLSTIVSIWVMWIAAFLSSISESAIWLLMKGGPSAPLRLPVPAVGSASARLLARLDAGHPGPILALSVRDHYVVVTTAQGQASLLMRFADAMAELDEVAGMQVHRSHWVAFAAVRGVVRRGGKTFLQLIDGRLVPVSRSYMDAVAGRWSAVPGNGSGLGGVPRRTGSAQDHPSP